MRMRTLMLTAVTAGVFHSAVATAYVESIVIEEDGQTAPIIEVGGPHRDAYREVLTETMIFKLRARGAAASSSADSTVNFTIDAIEGDAWVRKDPGPALRGVEEVQHPCAVFRCVDFFWSGAPGADPTLQ